LEYVHIEPFVYSHRYAVNTYEHFDALLGYPIGPNADRLHAELSGWVTSSVRWPPIRVSRCS
jgi:hypothetical protein